MQAQPLGTQGAARPGFHLQSGLREGDSVERDSDDCSQMRLAATAGRALYRGRWVDLRRPIRSVQATAPGA